MNGDTQVVVTGTPVLATTANAGSPVGTYPITITAGTLAATNYTFTFVNGTLTVTGGAAQTITFGPLGDVTYGVAPFTLTATASSGLPVSYAVTSGPATVAGSTLTITGAGSVTVTALQLGNGTYAAATPVPQTFMSSPATLTATADNQSRLFGDANPTLTYTIAGFVNGDTQVVVTGTPTLTTTANAGSAVGTYPITITAGTLAAANYTFAFVNGTLTVTGGAAQTITFEPLGDVTYGVAPITLTGTASSGLPVSYAVTSGPATVAGSTLTITGAGSVTVTASQLGDGTYAAAPPVPQTFTSSPATLTATVDNQTRLFGAANPTLTYTIAGFVNGDTQAAVSGTPVLATTANAGSPVGTYPITITAGTLAATNYTFTFVNGTLTVVGGVAQTITFGPLAPVTYGVAPITLTGTASSGLPVGYTVTSGPATVTGSTLTITGAGSVTVTASQLGDGTYAAATPVPQTFSVATATLMVTANNQSRLFGAANPTLTYTIAGFVNGDTQAVVSGTPVLATTANAGSPVGTYPITITAGTLAATNYTLRFVNGTLTVTGGAAQTITFGPLSNVTYGVAPITLTGTASSGLPVSYAVTSGPATVAGSTLTITGAGSVTVTALQLGDGTYAAATPVPQTFTVATATLTVTADNQTRLFGAANPTLTYTIAGFVNGDTQAVVSGTPTVTTTAINTSPVGTYPITITVGTLAATNYTFTFVNGTLTVTGGAAQTITFGPLSNVTYGVAPITLTGTASSGLPVSYAVTSGPATVAGSMLTITGAGSVTVTATQAGNGTYAAATPVPQTFSVATATLTVTANNLSLPVGQLIPALSYTITGFVNGETQAVVSGTPTVTTTATSTSPAGPYPITITAGTLAAANYTFTFVNGTLTLTSLTGNTYTTSFASPPAPENPISEGGNWINGGATGIDWGNVQTTAGLAFGTVVSPGPPYNDSTAVLSGTWGSDQAVSATVQTVNQNSSIFEEVELRLRTTITADSITGYEINFRATSDGTQYCQLIRWNGALDDFTGLTGQVSPGCPGLHNGDVVSATVIGSSICSYVNGVQIFCWTDTTFANGSPGMGFYMQGGTTGQLGDYGFTSFFATDSNVSSFVPAVRTARAGRLAQTTAASQTSVATSPSAVGLLSTSLAFGSQYVGDTSTAPIVTLSNNGNSTLIINSIAITGANAGDFAETNTCGSVAPGSTCTISVAFTPTLTTAETASITITDSSSDSPQTITLTGDGMVSAGQLMLLSPDKTHLVNTITGSPVFIMGEQAESLATNVSSNSDIELYLSTRQAMGFNVVSVRATDVANLVNYPDNALGQSPFNGAAFTSMNEAYWEHLDYVIERAAAHGITVLLNPAFVGSGPESCSEADGWCPDILAASDVNLRAYGVSIGNRYKSYPNIVWMLGGDNDLTDFPAMKAKLQDIANGITSVDSVHLMTIENQCPNCSSQDGWPAGSWNMDALYHDTAEMASAANASYLRSDYLPTFVSHDTPEGQSASPSDSKERAEAYQGVLGGASLGSVFGNCVVSYFGYEYQNCSTWTSSAQWRTWLNTTGAMGRMYLGNLMRSREFWKMVPDISHTVATSGFGSGDTVTTTSRSSDGQTIIAYIPSGNALTVNMANITSPGKTANCWWYDPRNGSAVEIGTFANTGTQIFTPPDSSDWVLVIDDASASVPAPGSEK